MSAPADPTGDLMNRCKRITAQASFWLLSSLIAFGQGGTVDIPAAKVQSDVKAVALDTKDFVVQIDESYNFQPIWPENPINRVEPKTKWNTLPVGKVLAQKRGVLDSFFPAIGATGWNPPDPDLAVGMSHVLAVVNSSISWFDKAGVKQFQQTAQAFFSGMGTGTFIFDPKCFYDRINGRFAILFLEKDNASLTSKLLLAVSDDGDPNGTWYRYRLEAKATINGNACWLDYPGFGYNRDAYVVSGNMFGFSTGFGGAQFVVIPSAAVRSGLPATATNIVDTGSSSVQIAEATSSTDDRVYGISRNGGSAVKVFAISNPSGTPTINSTSVTVPSNSGPTSDAQSTAGMLDTVDARVYNAVVRNGRMVTAHNIQNGATVGSRWYEVSLNGFPSGTPTLVQSGNIASGSTNYFCPAINVNSEGSIAALFTGSSSSITADINFAARNASDSAGSMGSIQTLESSAGNAYGGRWGDYFGVDVDPADDVTFWGIGSIVSANNGWQTSIFSWTVAGGITPPPPSEAELSSIALNPTSVKGGSVATGTVTLTASAPSTGATVTLSSDSQYATVPASVTVAAGQTSATFTIQTGRPARNANAVITATYRSISKSTSLTVRKK